MAGDIGLCWEARAGPICLDIGERVELSLVAGWVKGSQGSRPPPSAGPTGWGAGKAQAAPRPSSLSSLVASGGEGPPRRTFTLATPGGGPSAECYSPFLHRGKKICLDFH